MKLMVRVIQEGHAFRANCPALPGCRAQGTSREEALRKMEAAIRGYLASLNAAIPDKLQAMVMGA
jgi:predicted RNase H-like HicB family nuclease